MGLLPALGNAVQAAQLMTFETDLNTKEHSSSGTRCLEAGLSQTSMQLSGVQHLPRVGYTQHVPFPLLHLAPLQDLFHAFRFRTLQSALTAF